MTTSLESLLGKEVALKMVGKSLTGTIYGKLSKSFITNEFIVSSSYNEDFSFPRSSVSNVFELPNRSIIEINL